MKSYVKKGKILFAKLRRFGFLLTRNPLQGWQAIDAYSKGEIILIAAEKSSDYRYELNNFKIFYKQ